VDFENLRPYALRAREYGWAIAQPRASIDETPKRENELWKYMCEQMGIHEARELTIPASQKLFFTLSGADLTKEQADDLQRNYKTSIYYMAVFRYLDADGSERQQDFCAVKAGVNPAIILCNVHNSSSAELSCPITPIQRSYSKDGSQSFVYESGDVITVTGPVSRPSK
jgi:hypothetical protein